MNNSRKLKVENWLIGAILCVSSFQVFAAPPAAPFKVLFVRKDADSFKTVYESTVSELGKKYVVTDYTIEKSTEFSEVSEKITESKPDLVVFMDNKAVEFGLQYNKAQTDPNKKVKGIALMGLNFKSLLKGNTELAGIAYESPAYSLMVNYRFISEKPVKNILVFYRKSVFSERVEASRKELQKEGFNLTAVDVEAKGNSKEQVEMFLRENLEKMVAEGKHDALWVMLDSVLLNPLLFRDVWLKTTTTHPMPVLVETADLASPGLNFGLFATTPGLPELGNQAAQMIESILKDKTPPKEVGVESVVAVGKVLNAKRAEATGIKFKEANLSEVKKLE